MPNKADKRDLIDLERRIMDQLRDYIQQLLDKFANKDDVMKRFAQLSKKIREIMELLAKKGGHDEEDDAMFTKKPYGPVTCASCEKGLINISGLPVDYHVWKRLPFRDPNERIARYGQGFSKILAHMKATDVNDSNLIGSPGRNFAGHSTSVDDTYMYNTHHPGGAGGPYSQSNKIGVSNMKSRTPKGRAGRTQGTMRNAQYPCDTTQPGTSIDENMMMDDVGNNTKMNSSYIESNAKERTRFGDSVGPQLGTDTLPQLGQGLRSHHAGSE